ncbi:gamma-glutamyl-gamma-aminobutyrate hydrolase family protein [Streptomyces anulatus]|uniref:gamma-glutamyl-gamma-aminobutyrate hydrolase family protein n=1 Tax=Streptomyces anulatus TaxID=1892 RepID=UPI003440530E
MSRRPLIAIPSRFAASTSALRYAAVVTARALADAVYRAGGEPWPVHPVTVRPGSLLAGIAGAETVTASCYHHQCVSEPGEGLVAVAHAADGTVEAAELAGAAGWFLGVQWHPEDTAATDPVNRRLFDALVEAARN